jgi:hypothetical protein
MHEHGSIEVLSQINLSRENLEQIILPGVQAIVTTVECAEKLLPLPEPVIYLNFENHIEQDVNEG